MSWGVRLLAPILSVLGLWYLAIVFSGLPAFVIPRPERVLDVLWVDHAFILEHLWRTSVAAIRLSPASWAWAGVLFDLIPSRATC